MVQWLNLTNMSFALVACINPLKYYLQDKIAIELAVEAKVKADENMSFKCFVANHWSVRGKNKGRIGSTHLDLINNTSSFSTCNFGIAKLDEDNIGFRFEMFQFRNFRSKQGFSN